MNSKTQNKKIIGDKAEKAALNYLKKQGLIFIEANYHSHFGEIDLIMKDKQHLVFVEVRLRNDHNYANGIESVTITKQQKIIKTAILYLQKKQLFNKIACRFDIVGVTDHNDQFKFNWIKNAFQG